MARKIFKNAFHLVLGSALCVSLTACPQNSKPPPPAQKHVPTPEETYVEHTISYSGETLAEIAQWYTGKSSNWTAIRDANPNIKPDRLRLGQVILIPRNMVTNEKPFARKASKKPKAETNTDSAPSPTAEPTQSESETPTATPTEAPQLTPTEAPTPEPTSAPTVEPTAAATVAPEAPTPKPNSKDLEREKLLDELLK